MPPMSVSAHPDGLDAQAAELKSRPCEVGSGVLQAPVAGDVLHLPLTWVVREQDLRSFDGDKTAKAKKVGELVAERAKTEGIESVVFDRAGHKYHGRIAALADAAREGGLTF